MPQLYGYGLGDVYSDASNGWDNFINSTLPKLISSYGQYKVASDTAKAQTQLATAQAQAAASNPFYYGTASNPVTGGSLLPVLAIGGGALLLLYFAMKKD